MEVSALGPSAMMPRWVPRSPHSPHSDLDELKSARIGTLRVTVRRWLWPTGNRRAPCVPRAEQEQRVGKARAAVKAALEQRQSELEADRDARVLVEEAVDVTCLSIATASVRATRCRPFRRSSPTCS